MKIVLAVSLVLLVFGVGVIFADIGPGPATPDITIRFMDNGTPYEGEISAIFHCSEPAISGSSPLADRDIELVCDKGVCHNDNWFYKFNPCFYPKTGRVMYGVGGDAIIPSEGMAFTEGKAYEVKVDVGTGKVSQDSGLKICPFGMLLLGAGFFAVALMRNRVA